METAKVYVWKDPDDEPQYQWKVGTADVGGLITVRKEFESYQKAWDWMHENYVRETP